MLRTTYQWITSVGVYPRQILNFFPGLILLLRDYISFANHRQQEFKLSLNYPCLHDRKSQSGTASGHYFHQDLYVAQNIFQANPEKHVDIASRIDGFVAHVASFREVEVFDIRKLESQSDNITFKQMDLMSPSDKFNTYTDSLSCLHALEHFGLGRYGDLVDPRGHIKGLKNISKFIKPTGTLYLSVPIGKQRIEFNAHRVFHVDTILTMTEEVYDLKDFAYVDDNGNIHKNISLNEETINYCNQLNYGCGIFTFKKKQD